MHPNPKDDLEGRPEPPAPVAPGGPKVAVKTTESNEPAVTWTAQARARVEAEKAHIPTLAEQRRYAPKLVLLDGTERPTTVQHALIVMDRLDKLKTRLKSNPKGARKFKDTGVHYHGVVAVKGPDGADIPFEAVTA